MGSNEEFSINIDSSSMNADICRICLCEGDIDTTLITPCHCAGSLRFVHRECLQHWIRLSNIKNCELCEFQFIMQIKSKPITQWKHLEMSADQFTTLLRKIVFFSFVILSNYLTLYLLLRHMRRHGPMTYIRRFEPEFWMYLAVTIIQLICLVFYMRIQCKSYYQKCKANNRIIHVQNAPERPRYDRYVLRTTAESSSAETNVTPFKLDIDRNDEPKIDVKGVRDSRRFFNYIDNPGFQEEDNLEEDIENSISSDTDGTLWYKQTSKTQEENTVGEYTQAAVCQTYQSQIQWHN